MIALKVSKRKIPLILSPYTIFIYTMHVDVILYKDTRGQYLPPVRLLVTQPRVSLPARTPERFTIKQ